MVKGLTRRIVLVRSPDPEYFEEAIFIVRDGAAEKGVTGEEILRQAQEAAAACLPKKKRLSASLPPPLYALLGAGITALVWVITSI